MADRLQVKRDLSSVWSSVNPILSDGEFGFERDSNKLKIGNGVTPWNSLPYLPVSSPMAIAGESLGGHRVVIYHQGSIYYASASNVLHVNKVVGLTTSAFSSGNISYFTTEGVVTEPSWTWNLTTPIYLGDNGVLTQFPVNTTGFTMIIGTPITSTSMYVSLKTPIIL